MSNLDILFENRLASKEVGVLLGEDDNNLWIGNAWGLHLYKPAGNLPLDSSVVKESLVDAMRVTELAYATGGGLWLGTNQGLYFLQDEQSKPLQKDDWPRDEVISLCVVPDTEELWVTTIRELGYVANNNWKMAHTSAPCKMNSITTSHKNGESIIWGGGHDGLHRIGIDTLEDAFASDQEDDLSNVVQCLEVHQDVLWVGTPKALFRFHMGNRTWINCNLDADASFRDVRAILEDQYEERLWIGTWQDGLRSCSLKHEYYGVYLPESLSLTVPIISLATGRDGIWWAATFDGIYCRRPGQREWGLVPGNVPGRPPDTMNMGIVQTICAQTDAQWGSILWVGTTSGLYRYRPNAPTKWDSARDWRVSELEDVSIQTLSSDSYNHMWVGSAVGLFCQSTWQRYTAASVNALAFAKEGELWVGTTNGLELWSSPGAAAEFPGQPKKLFTVDNSGLASNTVTCLALQNEDDAIGVWIGSLNGLSYYTFDVK